ELIDVVRGPRHQVTNPLAIVESLALAELARVELLARGAPEALSKNLGREAPNQIEASPGQDEAQDAQGDQEEARRIRLSPKNLIEGIAGQHRDVRAQEIRHDRREEEAGDPASVMQDVRDDPAN